MKQFALSTPSEQQLGPLTRALRGRCLADVTLIRDGMLVRCSDGVVALVQWGGRGAELAGLRTVDPRRDFGPPDLAPRFQYLLGRAIDCVRSEEGVMGIVMADGHILRCHWRSKAPEPVAVDVRVVIECPAGIGMSGVIVH